MSKTVWHKGPPPSIGWWPASYVQDSNHLRWWNGRNWSVVAGKNYQISEVCFAAANDAYWPNDVEWTHRPKSWPARSKT